MEELKGHPDDPALRLRVSAVRLIAFDFDGVFTDNMVYFFEDGREAVRCWRGDGLGLRKLEQFGIDKVIISTEPNPVVVARSRKLKIQCYNGCDDKLEVLKRVTEGAGLSFDQVAYVGNDINDAPCLGKVGLPIVVRDAHPDVLGYAVYQTRRPGGRGAVREVCDLFAEVRSP